jgi:hypothetical protein
MLIPMSCENPETIPQNNEPIGLGNIRIAKRIKIP